MPLDLLWVTTHGEFGRQGYQLDLHREDLPLAAARLGYGGPNVLVLDTCDAVDLSHPTWQQLWLDAVGPDLRLVLGFSTPATVCESTSLRGRAFAQRILGGEPFASAWLDVATSSAYPGTDHPIAFALADTPQVAEQVLRTASLGNLPGPRGGSGPGVIEARPLGVW
jgi:hypothetical protein